MSDIIKQFLEADAKRTQATGEFPIKETIEFVRLSKIIAPAIRTMQGKLAALEADRDKMLADIEIAREALLKISDSVSIMCRVEAGIALSALDKYKGGV